MACRAVDRRRAALGTAHECRDPADQTRMVGTAEYADATAARDALGAASDFNRSGTPRRATPCRAVARHSRLVRGEHRRFVARCTAEAAEPSSTAWPRCARPWTSCATTPRTSGTSARRRSCSAPRRAQRFQARGPRRVCPHQPVEFPARIQRPDRGCACSRQHRARETGRTGPVAAEAVACLRRRAERRCGPGDGRARRSAVAGPRVAGVVFTGSVETAQAIARLPPAATARSRR